MNKQDRQSQNIVSNYISSPHLLRIPTSPFSNACLFLAAYLFSSISVAISAEKSTTDRQPEPRSDSWPVFRGNAACDGVAAGSLPDKLKVVWKKSFKDGAFDATATIVDGTVYVGSFDGNLYALDLADGKEKWKFHTELGFKAAAAVRDGVVYVGDVDGKFYALDAATGKENWSAESNAEINAGANFYQDKVLFASQDGGLYCLARADGKLAWKYTIDNMIQCSPTVVENRCFLAGCDGKLHIVNLDNGQGLAQLDIKDPTLSTPAAVGDRVYFGTQGGRFLAIDWKQENTVWSYEPKRKNPLLSSAAVAQGVVVFGGKDREIHALSAETGDELWSVPVRAAVDASPVIVGNRVYIGTMNGRLLGLELKTGKQIWEYEAGGGFPASPAVATGRLVIGNDAGDLYCFGE